MGRQVGVRGTTGYREDLEGLRGLAVLSVFAVHSVPQSASGGFVGVDVFLVLSGYLIAAQSRTQIESGRFSARDFYARRLRRLGPALIVVLAACLMFCWWFASTKDALAIGKHVMAGAAFVSNWVLWREAGYFDQSSEFKPLLHLWSLGIEAQFYVLWPLFVWAFVRAPKRVVQLVAVVLLASFALNVAMVGVKPKGTFFLPPTRLWEPLLGVLLAYGDRLADAVRRWARWPRPVRPGVLASAGVMLLLLPLWVVSPADRFPGWWALMPALGTVLVIGARGAWINRAVLAHPLLTFYGRISYPLYLWHWPLLTLPKLLGITLDTTAQVEIICASVALATATHYAVERPLRFGAMAEATPRLALVSLVLAGTLGGYVVASEGLTDRFPDEVRQIAEVHVRTDYLAYRAERCFLRSEQGPNAFAFECAGGGSGPAVALWGDSHAAALYPGLDRDRDFAGARLMQFTAAACPPMPAPATDNPHCGAVNAWVAQRLVALKPATVVLAAQWSRYGEPNSVVDGVRRTIAALRAAGVDRVLVVGPLPHWSTDPPRQLLWAWRRGDPLPERAQGGLDALALPLDQALQSAAEASGARYLSAIARLCNQAGCLLQVRDGGRHQVIAFDESHLTVAGSAMLARFIAGVVE